MVKKSLVVIAVAEAALVILGIYGYATVFAPGLSVASASNQQVTLTGAGATLAYPLLSAVESRYEASHPGIHVNYQPVGSIAGLSLLIDKTIDFAATYPPIPKSEWKNFPSLPLHIPESVSAVALAYNVPGLNNQPLRLNGTVLAGIYLGYIQTWDDQRIAALNPGQNLPHHAILPFTMAEAEGTTFVFSSYLAIFNSTLKPGTSVNWPPQAGIEQVPTDAGVANQIQLTQYSIGYMELSYALETHLPYASIENIAGNFIIPSSGSAASALRQLTRDLPRSDQDWSAVNLLNEPNPDAYPLVTFTYLIVYQDLSVVTGMDLAKAKALAAFVWYLVHDGQALGPPLGYVPLPASVLAVDETGVNLISFRGQHLLTS